MPIPFGPGSVINLTFGPEDVGALDWTPFDVSAAKNNATARDISVVDDNEPATGRYLFVVIHDERRTRLDRNLGDFIFNNRKPQPSGGFQRRRVNHSIHRRQLAINLLSQQFHPVALPDGQRLVSQPENSRPEPI